jgi:hypothetical protein
MNFQLAYYALIMLLVIALGVVLWHIGPQYPGIG